MNAMAHPGLRPFLSGSDAVEGRQPVITTCDGLPVDDAGPHAQLGYRLDNDRKSVG
jgi:hypothetical protein